MTTSVSANRKLPSQHRAFTFITHKVILKTKMEFSDQLPNFEIKIFDDEQNERVDGRFVPMTDSEVDNLIETGENANTKRKTLYNINFVKQFLTEHGERRSIEEIPAVKLNNYVSKSKVAARTKKGEEYVLHLEEFCRVLSATNVAPVIIKDNDFQKTRDTLKAKQKELKRQGKGNEPEATTALSDEEIDILYGKKVLGLALHKLL